MPRKLAFEVLGCILDKRQSFDIAFDAHPRTAKLDTRDRAFAYQMIATTLRRLGQIDALIDHCLEKPLPRKGRGAQHILRLGVTQLLFLRTPAHAAVDTSVDLAQSENLGPYKKLINAVLRRVEREGEDVIAGHDAEKLNTPDWLWQSWSAAHGEAETRKIAATHLIQAPIDLTLKAAGDDSGLAATLLPTGSLRLIEPGPITELAGFDDGAWWVQDAAAALPVKLFGDVRGQTIADLCAAPGGKTAQLAAAGANVIAIDRSEKRLKLLEQNLTRLNLTAEVVCAIAENWTPPERLDGVLLDAPCTSTGTIRRHPDIQRLKRPDDVRNITQVQTRLLAAAIGMVKPGGLIVYATCSLQPEEGPDIIEGLLATGAKVDRHPIQPDELGGLSELIDDQGDLRTLPSHLPALGGMDGFYACRLIRRE